MVFHEIMPQALSLMTDVFGNYVIQKVKEYYAHIFLYLYFLSFRYFLLFWGQVHLMPYVLLSFFSFSNMEALPR